MLFCKYKPAKLSPSRHHESIQVSRTGCSKFTSVRCLECDKLLLPFAGFEGPSVACAPHMHQEQHLYLPARSTNVCSCAVYHASEMRSRTHLAFLLQCCELLSGLSLPLATALSRDTLCCVQALLCGLWACARQLFIYDGCRLCP